MPTPTLSTGLCAWARVYTVLSSLEKKGQLDKTPRQLITHQKLL